MIGWNSRGQVTIFIIFALIIVVIIAIIFLLKLKTNVVMQIINENNPQGSIETCTKQAVEDALERITINGGDINPGFSVKYKNDDIVYICYSGEYYRPCAYQRPLLVEHIQRELVNDITPKIEDCFQKLKMKIGESSSVTDSPGIKVFVNLFPKHIGIKIEKNFRIERGDSSVSFDKFNIVMLHPIYDFADIAMEVGNQQAKYCYFDSLGYMILNPSFNIEETITADNDKIYVVTERATNYKYQFAARSCPLPPGY